MFQEEARAPVTFHKGSMHPPPPAKKRNPFYASDAAVVLHVRGELLSITMETMCPWRRLWRNPALFSVISWTRKEADFWSQRKTEGLHF